MPRQRARCRNPDCGTFIIHDRQAQVNDTTLAGFCKGLVLTLNFVVFFGALGLGALALTTSFKWAMAIWVFGIGSVIALHELERWLDGCATISYRYRCALCGRVWGAGGAVHKAASESDADMAAA